MKETDAFRVLGSADRQVLLNELVRTDGGIDEEDLARKVAASRHRLSPDSISEDKVKRAHIRLHHTHLPLLRDLNIIDQEDGEVVFADDERKDKLLDVAAEFGDWPPEDRLQGPLA